MCRIPLRYAGSPIKKVEDLGKSKRALEIKYNNKVGDDPEPLTDYQDVRGVALCVHDVAAQ